MVVQEPQGQDPKSKELKTPSVSKDQINKILRDVGITGNGGGFGGLFKMDRNEPPLASIEQAMTAAQNQEKHDAQMKKMSIDNAIKIRKMEEDSEAQDIKNQRERAKLMQDGLVTLPQGFDPKQPPVTEPVDLVPDELKQEAEFRKRYQENKAAQESDGAYRRFMRDAILQSTQEMLSEKSLRYAHGGAIGQLFGDILDIGSEIATLGNYKLGTELLGGTIEGADKAAFLSRIAASTSPLFKGEVEYQSSKGKREMTAGMRLAENGLPVGLAALTGGANAGASSVDETIVLAQDLQLGLADDVELKKHFSTEAETPVGRAYKAFQNYQKADTMIQQLLDIQDPTEEDVKSLDKLLTQRTAYESAFNEFILEYAANGGNPETLNDVVKLAQQYIDTNYTRVPFGDDPEASAHSKQSIILRKMIGGIYATEFTDFGSKAISTMLDEQAVVERKYGKESTIVREISKIEDVPQGTYLKGSPSRGTRQPINKEVIGRMATLLKTRYSKETAYNKLGDSLHDITLHLKMDKPERQKLAQILHDSVKGSQHEDIKHKLIDELIISRTYKRQYSPTDLEKRGGPTGH